jgi:hypothetical protein
MAASSQIEPLGRGLPVRIKQSPFCHILVKSIPICTYTATTTLCLDLYMLWCNIYPRKSQTLIFGVLLIWFC